MDLNIIDKIRNRGIRSGVSMTDNSIKMAVYISAPLLAGWFISKLLLPPEISDTASVIILGAWCMVAFGMYSKFKSDTVEYTKFPTSQWHFPDGQQIAFDLFLPKDGYEELKEYTLATDGTKAYRVRFKDKLFYQDPDLSNPTIFDNAIWKLPSTWTETFDFNAYGEFFFGTFFVNAVGCEFIHIAVTGWDERGGSRIPICLITGSSWYYWQVLKNQGKAILEIKGNTASDKDAAIADLKKMKEKLKSRVDYLEDEIEHFHSEQPEHANELADKRIDGFLKRHKGIMNAGKKSLLMRLLNGKYIAIVLIVIAVLGIAMHFIMGWP